MAGGQHPQQGAGPQEGVDQGGGVRQDVLAVVDQQHRLHQPEVVDQGVDQRCGPWFHHAHRRGHGPGHLGAVAHRGQVDEPGPAGVGSQRPVRDLQRETGLARPRRSGEGDQAIAFQQPANLAQLPSPADEAGELGGQVLGRRATPDVAHAASRPAPRPCSSRSSDR